MKISVATVDFTINGNLLNAVDTQNYFDCDLFILKPVYDFVKDYMKLRGTIYRKLSALPFKDKITSDILIVDYKAFLYILIHKLDIKCEKLIVMDCLELSLHQQLKTDSEFFCILGQSPPDIELMCSLLFPKTEIQFLMPKVNHDKWNHPFFKADVFHKKINFDIMGIPEIKNNDFVFREDHNTINEFLIQSYPSAKSITFGKELYESRNFIYSRRTHLSYIEQFGRILFELYYFGRSVWMISDNALENHDGLSEYLQNLGASMEHCKLYIPCIDDMDMNNYNYMEKYL